MIISIKNKRYAFIALASILLSSTALAEVTTRDALIQDVKAAMPDEICKQAMNAPEIAKAQKEHGITLDSCKQKVIAIGDTCLNKFKDSLPQSLDSKNPNDMKIVKEVMQEVGTCVGNDYISQLK